MKVDNPSHYFDEDPEENLRIENAILKLKLQAERGALIFSDNELPPDLEAEFLQRVCAFEEAWQDVKMVKIYDLIGQPQVIEAEYLDDDDIKPEIDKIISLLLEHQIQVTDPNEIDQLGFYKFLIEELYQMETEDLKMEGFMKFFDYYEFHPDHKKDIADRVQTFLDNWLRKNLEGLDWDLENQIVQPHGIPLDREVVKERIRRNFDAITVLKDGSFQLMDVKFKWDEENEMGMGHAEGVIYYEAERDGSFSDCYGGPFIVYLSNRYGCWGICYFEIPGFDWDE